MGSSDELVAKLRGGSAANYDMISPSSDVATSIVNAGLTEPLDLRKLRAYSRLSPALTSLPLVKKDGKVYGVPFQWGPNPLLYDTTFFNTTPDSWNVMWTPEVKGKVFVWDDLSTVYMAAQILGYDQPDPSALYHLSDEQLAGTKKKLLELKPNVRKIWSTGGELTNFFQNNEIWDSVWNSAKVALAAVLLSLLSGVPAALALDRARIPGSASSANWRCCHSLCWALSPDSRC
jgi:spermidine/putrescine-binding protein